MTFGTNVPRGYRGLWIDWRSQIFDLTYVILSRRRPWRHVMMSRSAATWLVNTKRLPRPMQQRSATSWGVCSLAWSHTASVTLQLWDGVSWRTVLYSSQLNSIGDVCVLPLFALSVQQSPDSLVSINSSCSYMSTTDSLKRSRLDSDIQLFNLRSHSARLAEDIPAHQALRPWFDLSLCRPLVEDRDVSRPHPRLVYLFSFSRSIILIWIRQILTDLQYFYCRTQHQSWNNFTKRQTCRYTHYLVKY